MLVVGSVWTILLVDLPGQQLWTYLQAATSYLAPPIVVVFTLGILWERITETGAFWSLLIGINLFLFLALFII